MELISIVPFKLQHLAGFENRHMPCRGPRWLDQSKNLIHETKLEGEEIKEESTNGMNCM